MAGPSNYPSGFLNGVTVRGVPITTLHPGKVFWVNNSGILAEGGVAGSNGNPGTYQKPFSTIDYAVGRCKASRGDIIAIMPGHVETVTAAAGLALDVAGIAVVGLGTGSLRATVNFTTAVTADMDVDAANVTLYNILFLGGIDDLTAPLDINAADCSIINCETRDVTGQFARCIVADANANRLLIDGHFHNGAAAAGTVNAIQLTGMDHPVIKNFSIIGNFSNSAMEFITTAVTNHEIYEGYIWTKNAADVCIKDTITASTGRIGPNLHLMLTDNAANITEAITAATAQVFQPINIINLAGESSMFTNITASTDA